MPTIPDPKWLEILKASGGQTAALALACGIFLLVAHWGWLPPLDPRMVIRATFGFLVFGFLAIAALGAAVNKTIPMREWVVDYVNERRFCRAVHEYISHMTERERKIIAYLLSKNQKQFTCDQDGSYLTSLISRRIVVYAYQPRQVFRGTDVPMRIPDNVWDILKAYRSEFPYQPPRQGEIEPEPWRIPWMAR